MVTWLRSIELKHKIKLIKVTVNLMITFFFNYNFIELRKSTNKFFLYFSCFFDPPSPLSQIKEDLPIISNASKL